MDSFPDSLIRPFLRAGRQHWLEAARDVLGGGIRQSPRHFACTCGVHGDSFVPVEELARDTYFVYRAGSTAQVSCRVRVAGLSATLASCVINPYRLRVITEEKLARLRPQNSDLLFSKYTLNESNLSWVKGFRRDGNRLFIDLVDGVGSRALDDLPDVFICSSRSEQLFRQSQGRKSHYVPHQVDSRFPELPFDKRDYEIVYLGAHNGALHLDKLSEIRSEITRGALTDKALQAVVNRVAGASHHYSVRTPLDSRVFKPAAKAFVAARLGAVFIGSLDDEETVLTLGRGYPYLADNSTLRSVREVLRFAAETHRKAPWESAKKVMEELKRETCDFSVGVALAEGLRA